MMTASRNFFADAARGPFRDLLYPRFFTIPRAFFMLATLGSELFGAFAIWYRDPAVKK
jgi:hypothetical protein